MFLDQFLISIKIFLAMIMNIKEEHYVIEIVKKLD